MHFESQNAYFFFQKKKYVCLPYLKFSDPLPETHLICFIWPYVVENGNYFVLQITKLVDFPLGQPQLLVVL